MGYSRLSREEFVPEVVDPDEAVAEAWRQVAEGSKAELSVERPLPKVHAHRTILLQVLANLLSNAIKFVAPGVEPRVRVRGERREGKVRLWVEDNGIGIAPEHQGRIFRVFERLHASGEYPGTGVGLAIVRRALERLGGQAGVESQPGRGSRFWIELPGA